MEEGCGDGDHHEQRHERPERPERVAGEEPVQPHGPALPPLAQPPAEAALRPAVAAHLHLAVVEVGGTGLVLLVLQPLPQGAVELRDLGRLRVAEPRSRPLPVRIAVPPVTPDPPAIPVAPAVLLPDRPPAGPARRLREPAVP